MRTMSSTSLVQVYDARLRRARRTGWTVGIGAWVAAVFLLAVLKSVPGQSSLLDLLIGLAQSLLVATPFLGYVAYARIAKTEGLLVWLRRFRGSYGPRIRFHRLLGASCFGMLHPVTIQDRSFKSSAMFSLLRLWVLTPLLTIGWLLGLLVVMALAFPVLVSGSDSTMVILMVGWTGLYVWGVWKVVTRAGFTSMVGPSAQHAAQRRLQAAQAGGRALGYGVEVLKCDDQVWQSVVVEALSHARVAVIDVTEVTDNLFWELSQALTHLDKDRIVLAAEEGATTAEDLATLLCGALTRSSGQAVDQQWVEAALFTYPARQAPPSGRRQQYKLMVEQLRGQLAVRMAR
jgi:hypothetical protein